MSLFDKESIINFYRKIKEKSIYIGGRIGIFLRKIREKPIYIGVGERIDIFLMLAILILIIAPLFVNLSFKGGAKPKQVNLSLSLNCEKLFGTEITEILLKEFGERYPDFRFQLLNASVATPEAKGRDSKPDKKTKGSPSSAETKVRVLAPDILIFDDEDFSALVAEGALMELNSYTNYESGSKQFAIPLVSFMDMLFYNINILSSAGFIRPPKTREEFAAYAKAVSGGNFSGASGAAVSLSQKDHHSLSRDIFSWIWAAGGNFWSEEENRPVLNTRAIISDITFLGSLNRDGAFAPEIFNTSGEQRLEQFAQGKTAMMIASTRDISLLRKKMGDDAFGITTVPVPGTGGRYGTGLSTIYAGINADTAHPDEAWSFLEFLTEKLSLFCTELKAVPGAVSDLIPGDYVREDPFYSKAWDIFESSRVVQGFTGKPNAEEYETAFLEELKIFFETNRTAQETVSAIQSRWDEISTKGETKEEQ
jgi:ABC-type glycerol-3-phosphate transport system substrate-binding protein